MGRYVSVDVEVELDDFDDDDLIDELERRGLDYNTKGVNADQARAFLEEVYYKRRVGQDYNTALDNLIYSILGKIV